MTWGRGILKFLISKFILNYDLNKTRPSSLFYPFKGRLFSIRQTGIRSYSTSSNYSSDSSGKVIFFDADKDKLDILNYVKGKTGIYMWINKLNGKKYVGSSVDLRRRLLEYYNVNRLLNESSMPINVALLKYGYHNFSLTILEICDVDNLMSREKHFFEEYTPEYNILDTPGNPSRGSGWRHSEAAIENMRIAAHNRNKSPEILAKLSTAQPNSIKVEVVDIETNISTRYNAIRAAARALDIDRRYIENYIYLNQDNPVLGKYIFKLINSSDKIKEKVQITSKKIKVININTKEVTIYTSIGAAARALGYRQASISLYLKENRTKPFKGLYIFKLA